MLFKSLLGFGRRELVNVYHLSRILTESGLLLEDMLHFITVERVVLVLHGIIGRTFSRLFQCNNRTRGRAYRY